MVHFFIPLPNDLTIPLPFPDLPRLRFQSGTSNENISGHNFRHDALPTRMVYQASIPSRICHPCQSYRYVHSALVDFTDSLSILFQVDNISLFAEFRRQTVIPFSGFKKISSNKYLCWYLNLVSSHPFSYDHECVSQQVRSVPLFHVESIRVLHG